MRAVNLLPVDLQTRKSLRQEDPAVVVGSALGVVVMIALGASFMVAHGKANAEQARLTTSRLELAQLSLHQRPKPKPTKPSAPITPIVPPPAITGQEASWLSAVSSTLSQRIAWDRVLREVSLVIPDDVTLTTMTMTAPAAAAAPVPGVVTASGPAQGFVIAGDAYSYDSVARLLSRLSLVPDLSDVTLTSTSSTGAPGSASSSTGSDGGGVTFNISAAVKGAPAPPAAPAAVVPAATDTTATTSGVSE
jgi:Tfp pilus assembly protein PilN